MALADDYVKTTCKIGQLAACCKYLSVSRHGFCCEKLTELRRHIDQRTDMTAKADNCEGKIND